ncbi:MAG: hypothetical protein Q7T80_14725 [Methanoregula sp.]|nr:hypothetical protein [Methanoregula sp.]
MRKGLGYSPETEGRAISSPLKPGGLAGLVYGGQPGDGERGAFGNCPEQGRAPDRAGTGAFGKMSEV